MTPEQRLAALMARAKVLETKIAGEDYTAEEIDESLQVAKDIGEVRELIARKDAASKALGSIQVIEPVQSNDDHNPTDNGAVAKSRLSVGARFVASEAYKSFKDNNPKGLSDGAALPELRAKDLGRVKTARKLLNTADTGNAAPVRTNEVDDLVFRPERRLLDLITIAKSGVPWFEYRQVVSKTNNAAIVPEASTSAPIGSGTPAVTAAQGGRKPLSTLTTQTAQAKAYTYADGMEATNQELADDQVIQSLIDSTLVENLEICLEDILLNGDSAGGEEPDGIINTNGVLHQGFVESMAVSVRKAITRVRVTSGATIRGVLMNPEDDEAWDLMKDLQERFLGNGPHATGDPRAWGYERIVSQAIPVGQAILGDFKTVSLLEYEPLSVVAFNQHEDFARRNLVYIRAELRALQLIRNAARLCIVDLSA